jgi:predicted phosphodiesterase
MTKVRADARLAIVSDIHGNLTALDAVIADIERRGVDRVVHGGDLALVGCQPAEVVDRVRELGWPGIVGNTDELLWRPEELATQEQRAPKLQRLLRLLFNECSPATRELLGEERISWLRALPAGWRDGELAVIHASPGDLWRAPSPEAEDAELSATYAPCDAQIVVFGHIHRPFVRRLDRMLVGNSGSVGSPFDGDPRASYLLVSSGDVQLIRVEYDVDREVAMLRQSDYPDAHRIAVMRQRGTFIPMSTQSPEQPIRRGR